MDASLETLNRCFLQTFSSDCQSWRQAENYLASMAERPGYAVAVLRLLSDASVPSQARLAASITFKNHVRSRWSPSPGSATITDAEKEHVKAMTVPVMLASQPPIQGQLSESLAIIGTFDFPRKWPGLLPELVACIRSTAASSDYSTINGVLATLRSIFKKKFRAGCKSNDLLLDLKYCLDGFAAPLLELFLRTGRLIDSAIAGRSNGGTLLFRRWFDSQRLCCRIFYSLNYLDLPEFFEDHMSEWMGEFLKYLTTTYPSLDDDEFHGGREVVDKLRKAVCKNLNLYMNKNEEEFRPFLSSFASAVWRLLISISGKPNHEMLTVAAIKFLTTISTSVDHSLFASPDTLRLIYESIVIPNVRVREDDEEEFENDHVEYIRRDIEGSDVDTRRRVACELVRGLVTNYREQVRSLVFTEVQRMMEKYVRNPLENWKDKDCAILLVVSLANNDLVDVESFFNAAIVPELKCTNVNSQPMLKANALKFFTMFNRRIPKNVVLQLLPHVIRFLAAESNVVHSYAANCIEKLLLVKEYDGRAGYTASDISPFLIPLMTNLYQVFELPKSEENQYAMKCIMRVFGVADFSVGVAAACVAGLRARLINVCKNPQNPSFNHYLFESVAALLRRTCWKDPSLIKIFESSLFDILQKILGEDITGFLPYALQIFALMIDVNRPPLPTTYMQLFSPLLSPELWMTRSNVPALVRLLQAYLQKGPMELNQRLSEVLGIFQNLIDSARAEEYGFYIVNTVVENLSYDVISPYVPHIWNALFTRLHNQRTIKFIKSLVLFMSLFLVKHGHVALVNTIHAVQEDLFEVILELFWIPNLKLITGFIEVKLCLVASTRLLCESPSLLQNSPPTLFLWGKMLDSIVTLLSQPVQERGDVEPEVPDIDEVNTASCLPLYNAGRKEEDILKDIKDPRQYVITRLAKLSALSPRKYPAIIQRSLDPANQVALFQLCGMYNCSIV
ncbi:unnamed protein product [Victoria cruziana]